MGITPFKFFRAEPRDENIITFGYFGSIHPIKNVDKLVRIFREVGREDQRLLIWGHGRGEFIDQLHEAIGGDPRIECKGRFTPQDLPSILSQIDMTIIPSETESYSFTARESLSAGVPVIGPNRGGLADIIESDMGILFESDAMETNLFSILGKISKAYIKTRLQRAPFSPVDIAEDAQAWKVRYKKCLK
jgi:glycosyltransferase involved in cell wall biosynthesis